MTDEFEIGDIVFHRYDSFEPGTVTAINKHGGAVVRWRDGGSQEGYDYDIRYLSKTGLKVMDYDDNR